MIPFLNTGTATTELRLMETLLKNGYNGINS